jgi:hypothetical protein
VAFASTHVWMLSVGLVLARQFWTLLTLGYRHLVLPRLRNKQVQPHDVARAFQKQMYVPRLPVEKHHCDYADGCNIDPTTGYCYQVTLYKLDNGGTG